MKYLNTLWLVCSLIPSVASACIGSGANIGLNTENSPYPFGDGMRLNASGNGFDARTKDGKRYSCHFQFKDKHTSLCINDTCYDLSKANTVPVKNKTENQVAKFEIPGDGKAYLVSGDVKIAFEYSFVKEYSLPREEGEEPTFEPMKNPLSNDHDGEEPGVTAYKRVRHTTVVSRVEKGRVTGSATVHVLMNEAETVKGGAPNGEANLTSGNTYTTEKDSPGCGPNVTASHPPEVDEWIEWAEEEEARDAARGASYRRQGKGRAERQQVRSGKGKPKGHK